VIPRARRSGGAASLAPVTTEKTSPTRPALRAASVEVRGLSKTFSGTRALDRVDLAVQAGSVHALLGRNGSGKSTLFKILSGYHHPDPGGELFVAGRPVELPLSPGDPPRLGFSFVHQDLGLIDSFSILENLRMGRFATGLGGRIRWRQERRDVIRLLRDFGLRASPDAALATLAPAERAIVAILRAVQPREGEPQTLLVLDEPTAYLPPPDIGHLFETVRELRDSGVAVLFATHRLDEVVEIADRVSVLRDGRLLETREVDETTEEQLIEAIIGEPLGDLYPAPPSGGGRSVALSVRRLSHEVVEDVSFDVHEGEVLGLTGLVGMGHDEIPYLVFGATRAARGEICVGGAQPGPLSPRQALGQGVALLPADRARQSGIQEVSLRENISMPILGRYFAHGKLDQSGERRVTLELLARFAVQPRGDSERRLSTLSGGNQQKALLAKWMQIPELRALLLHEPTQGVDIGSRKTIFEFIRAAADEGAAIVIASSEYDDLAHLCDRVLILRHGRIVRELLGAELTEERIVEWCYRTGR
jgi:ribose transport system ATP-binding protein